MLFFSSIIIHTVLFLVHEHARFIHLVPLIPGNAKRITCVIHDLGLDKIRVVEFLDSYWHVRGSCFVYDDIIIT